MPATRQSVHCSECRRARPRAEMSIFEGICNQCFDEHYLLCTDCGALLRRNPNPDRYNRYHLGGGVYQVDGVLCCCACHVDRRSRQGDRGYWRPKPFDVSFATYQRIGSKRKFGVEIETSRCNRCEELYGLTNFGCKDDPTVSGSEFDSPILYGDEGLNHINTFLTLAAQRSWEVNRDCGCHTHYDMRDESNEHLYRITYAYRWTYRMWKRCVPSNRRRSSYCHPMNYSPADVVQHYNDGREFENFVTGNDRYDYFNTTAYREHQTFEIRLLEGSLDSNVICNWITVHCRFMDCVKNLSFLELKRLFRCNSDIQFQVLVDLIDDASLTDWVANRARYVGERPLRGPRSASSPAEQAAQPRDSRGRYTPRLDTTLYRSRRG